MVGVAQQQDDCKTGRMVLIARYPLKGTALIVIPNSGRKAAESNARHWLQAAKWHPAITARNTDDFANKSYDIVGLVPQESSLLARASY